MKIFVRTCIYLIAAVLCAFALAGFILAPQDSNNAKRDSPAFSAVSSGQTLTIDNWRGDGSNSFEYIFSGSPATASVPLSGCMRGGTCETIETYTLTTNTIRVYGGPKIYDTFTIAPTFTGGSSPTLTVNRTAVKQSTGNFFLGQLKTVTVSNPAAGTDWNQAVPSGKIWRIIAFQATLTASVAAANRQVRLVLDDGTNPFFTADSNFNQALSITAKYSAGNGDSVVQSNNIVLLPLPTPLLMPAPFRISVTTANIQAADQWSAITLYVEEMDR